jgi:hypothetical protein
MGFGFSFGVGRNLDSCSICTDQVRNWGSKCHFSTFLFFILYGFVHLHFQRWKCYFYCTFWYLFESNVLCGCILHVYWICQQTGAELSEAFEIKQLPFFCSRISKTFSRAECLTRVAWLQMWGEVK